TYDPMIKSHLLYQLSYAPGTSREKPLLVTCARRLAKRPYDVQQGSGVFPTRQHGLNIRKATGFRWLFLCLNGQRCS
ncbi:MAG: hypothetical protein KGK01_18890, partial [Bradyrhizobium sp.]|nr:hypothetical protein [Bradyrhizobium sp.]